MELRDTISESSRSPLPPSPPTYMASASLGRPARPSSAARSGNSRSEGNWASTWPGAGAGVSACTGTGAGGKGVVAAPVQHCSTPAPWIATGRAWPCYPRPWETELLVDLVDMLFLIAGVILPNKSQQQILTSIHKQIPPPIPKQIPAPRRPCPGWRRR